jgi:hypothetical protein
MHTRLLQADLGHSVGLSALAPSSEHGGAFFIKENGVARSVKQVSNPAHEGFELVRFEQEIDSDEYRC